MKTRKNLIIVIGLIQIFCTAQMYAQNRDWYTQGDDFNPETRIKITIKNSLDQERLNCPVIIPRSDFPIPDVHEMWVTVVDPSLPPQEAPSDELLALQGGHEMREETNGHAIHHQLDDLDKDGIWDELFFQTNVEPNEEKTLYVYIGMNTRGWNKHGTHANVGSYCRHLMPFWESEHVGWKIWFANSVDVFAKRAPVLMSHILYTENRDGYGVSNTNKDYGSDIQSVASTFGGGAICLFEHPDDPDSVSLPRKTPVQQMKTLDEHWNAGQISDTRYAYEVVVNGPSRSIVKIKTMNWNTGDGSYTLEQYYTAYANHNYSTCEVRYVDFHPMKRGVKMGCGIRKKPGDEDLVLKEGIVISSGPEGIRDPEDIDDRNPIMVDFIGKAIVVKDEYDPEYQFVEARGGNHAFKVDPDHNNSFEYAIFAAWSEGAFLNTQEQFEEYVMNISSELNNPVIGECGKPENK
jgi:hypothetical protein